MSPATSGLDGHSIEMQAIKQKMINSMFYFLQRYKIFLDVWGLRVIIRHTLRCPVRKVGGGVCYVFRNLKVSVGFF